MKIQITVRGIEEKEAQKSESIKNYINNSFLKLQELLSHEQEPIQIDMVATVVRPHPSHEFEVHIKGPRYNIIAKRTGPEIYKIIDETIDIAHQEFLKHRKKFLDNQRREGAERKIQQRAIKNFGKDEE